MVKNIGLIGDSIGHGYYDEYDKGWFSRLGNLILSQQASITADIAYRLSQMLGTSSEIWLNLQSKYDAYLVQLNALEKFEEEKQIFKMIDKKFLLQLNIIENDDIPFALAVLI